METDLLLAFQVTEYHKELGDFEVALKTIGGGTVTSQPIEYKPCTKSSAINDKTIVKEKSIKNLDEKWNCIDSNITLMGTETTPEGQYFSIEFNLDEQKVAAFLKK